MGALDGVRVVDFTRYLAGPYCTQLLADHGADVVKVESPGPREFGGGPDAPDSWFFLMANRGKRSVVVDHETDDGLDLLRRLVADAGVVVDNYRPGVMARRGLDPDELCARHPRLVWCSITGFGADGPLADRPGFDQIAQGMSGLMAVTGTEESGPTRVGIAISDLLAGMTAVQGIQAALLARHTTGRGQRVDTSLLEATLGVMSWSAGMWFDRREHPGPAGQHHPLSSPYGRFRAGDGHLNIAAGAQHMWEALTEVLGAPQWRDDPRFAGPGDRVRHRSELTAAMEAVLVTDSVGVWVERLNAAGVPCGPVLGLDEVFTHPQVLARGMVRQLDHPVRGTIDTLGVPVTLHDTPGDVGRPPPLHGQHSREVAAEAGLGDDEIEALVRSGVLGTVASA